MNAPDLAPPPVSADALPQAPVFPFRRTTPLDPPDLYARARREQPVFEVTLWDGRRAWLVTRYDDVRRILVDPRFSGEFGNPDFPAVTAARRVVDKQERAFVGMDNPRHDFYRRMFTREFSTKRMAAMRPRVVAIASGLIDELAASGPPADLVASIGVRFPSMVMCDLIGSPYEDHRFIMTCAAARHGLTQSPEEAERKARELADYFGRLIDARTAVPADDLVSRIIAEQVAPGHLTREEFAEIGAMILRAGHDTTANMIGIGTLLFLLHPDQMAAMRDDPEVVPGAVEELLRFVSPVQFSPRRVALEDVDFSGVTIRKGEGVFALNPSANRDERMFAEPDRFDIRRDASDHIAFGYGIHQCLGQMLARMELQVILPMLFQRLPALRLAAPMSAIRFKNDMQIYGLHNLPVAW